MSFLAIDFGLKRIGIAVSQGFLAKPLTTLLNNQKIFSKLKKICREFDVGKIVLGLPEGKLRQTILKFGKTCQKKLRVEVEFEDEVLTTRQASQLLIEAQKLAKNRKRIVDAAAAAVILQQYLDRNR